jgi:hypothetical protein
MAYLTHYCDYHSLLKEIILNKEETKSPQNRFMREYSRLHSEDSVSKLFNELIDKDIQMRKNNKLYGQECLFDYFRLKEFTCEKIVPTLIRRIIDAKRKGIIDYEDKPKKGKSFYKLD